MNDIKITIPNTNGRYGITQKGDVFNLKTGREVLPFRRNSIKLRMQDGKIRTLNISKTVDLCFSAGYVSDSPDLMQNIEIQLITIQNMVGKLLKEIRGDKRYK